MSSGGIPDVLTEQDALLEAIGQLQDSTPPGPRPQGDARDGSVYVLTPAIQTAIKVAIVTGRPLLLSGPPGCGKSSLASYVARNLQTPYYEYIVTDDAEPQDLLWRMDTVRRFNDAQHGVLDPAREGGRTLYEYIEPGPLWWSLDPESARRRAAPPEIAARDGFRLAEPPGWSFQGGTSRRGAVLLIDEIDKAESSFANALLVPLGSRQFFVSPVDRLILAGSEQMPGAPIVFITTNNERELPQAFVRRCIVLAVESPSPERLVEIAGRHFGERVAEPTVSEQVATLARRLAGREHLERTGRSASTAEFLDLIQALLTLKIELGSEDWEVVEQLIVEKPAVHRARLTEW